MRFMRGAKSPPRRANTLGQPDSAGEWSNWAACTEVPERGAEELLRGSTECDEEHPDPEHEDDHPAHRPGFCAVPFPRGSTTWRIAQPHKLVLVLLP